MKCFYHQERDAVAVCKNCNKGVCAECASDLGHGIACKGRCESKVQELNELIECNKVLSKQSQEMIAKNKTLCRKSGYTLVGGAAISALVGAVFIWFGWYYNENPFIITLGGIFLLAAVLEYIGGKGIAKHG
jgi:hypothetical protein